MTPETFWGRVRKGPRLTDCWTWTGTTNHAGYGSVHHNGHRTGAHRLAYEWLRGPIPDGLTVDHMCNVKDCVNPAHMQLVDRAENVRLAFARRFGMRQYRYQAGYLEKTHCKQGHPFTPDNTYVWPDGKRKRCLTCHRAEHHRARSEGRWNETPRSVRDAS